MLSTKDKIINASINLFYDIPYADVSLLEISKTANISNGIIYKYFKNKEDLFKFLLEMISNKIENKLKYISSNTLEDGLRIYIEKNLEITREEYKLIKIFREGQYRFIEFEHRIKKAYLKSLESIFQRKLNKYEIMYILGAIRYINISFSSRNLKLDVKFLVNILLNGFSKEKIFSIENISEMELYQRKRLNTNNKKYQLLKKGELLFGMREYHDVKIKDLAKAMDISVGSFYSFFPTKDIFLNEIIDHLKKEILFLVKDNYNKDLQTNELHTMYLFLFLEYYKESSFKYKLLRDIEFLHFDIYIDFLNNIESFYISTLHKNINNFDEKRIISNLLLGIQHYMIIEIFFTKEIKDSNLLLKEISKLFTFGIK